MIEGVIRAFTNGGILAECPACDDISLTYVARQDEPLTSLVVPSTVGEYLIVRILLHRRGADRAAIDEKDVELVGSVTALVFMQGSTHKVPAHGVQEGDEYEVIFTNLSARTCAFSPAVIVTQP